MAIIQTKYVDLFFIKKYAKYYLLCFEDNSAIAITKVNKGEPMQEGYRIKREYNPIDKYYFVFEYTKIDVGWALSRYRTIHDIVREPKYDITRNHKIAIALAKKHVT